MRFCCVHACVGVCVLTKLGIIICSLTTIVAQLKKIEISRLCHPTVSYIVQYKAAAMYNDSTSESQEITLVSLLYCVIIEWVKSRTA